jgi:hypothetical protein
VSGTYEKLMDFDKTPREEALALARQEAVELAVAAGAVRDTVKSWTWKTCRWPITRAYQPREVKAAGIWRMRRLVLTTRNRGNRLGE